MRKKLLSYTFSAAMTLVAAMASSAFAAPVPIPSVYWSFANDDGQVPGSQDSLIKPTAPTPSWNSSPNLALWNRSVMSPTGGQVVLAPGSSIFNGASSYTTTSSAAGPAFSGGANYNYRNAGAGNGVATTTNPTTLGTPINNYRGAVAAGPTWTPVTHIGVPQAPNNPTFSTLGARESFENVPVPKPYLSNTVYHAEGGRARYFAAPTGTTINPQTSPFIADDLSNALPGQVAYLPGGAIGGGGQYRDQLTLVGTAAGNESNLWNTTTFPSNSTTWTNSAVNSAGGYLTYSLWLNVLSATNAYTPVESNLYTQSDSKVIGRGGGSNAGEVAIRGNKGGAGSTDWILQVRNNAGTGGSNLDSLNGGANTLLFKSGWHHWVVQYDLNQNGGQATIFMDGGVLAGGSEQTFTGLGTNAITGLFRLNGNDVRTETGDFFISQLAVFNGAPLSPADVKLIYDVGVVAAAVPEPSSFVLGTLAVAGLFAFRRKRK